MLDLEVWVSGFDNDMFVFVLSLSHNHSVGYGDNYNLKRKKKIITLHQGIFWAKKKYLDDEETLNKSRQLQKVQ